MSLRIAVDNGRDKHDNYSHIRRRIVVMTDNRGELVLPYFVERVFDCSTMRFWVIPQHRSTY